MSEIAEYKIVEDQVSEEINVVMETINDVMESIIDDVESKQEEINVKLKEINLEEKKDVCLPLPCTLQTEAEETQLIYVLHL